MACWCRRASRTGSRGPSSRSSPDPGLRRTMGGLGLEKSRRYDWRVVGDRILDVYAQARERARDPIAWSR